MKKASASKPVIPCELSDERRQGIVDYADALRKAAPEVGGHGMSTEEFWRSGLFQSAIEKLRGSQAATTGGKHAFLGEVLGHLKNAGLIASYEFTGSGDRHDYQISFEDGWKTVFEAKGCLDGNNTNIFQRPSNADEFFIWSLCQNPGADPRHNVWSGLRTRLGTAMLAEKQRIDALIVWDMLCGTAARPCPKLAADPKRSTFLAGGRSVPPPCIYLFPRTLPEPRNNPAPPVWKLADLRFVSLLAKAFGARADEAVEVHIETRMNEAQLQRRTLLSTKAKTLHESGWTTLKRVR